MSMLSKSARCPVMVLIAALVLAITTKAGSVVPTPADTESIKLATDVFKQLVEINSTDSVGSTLQAEILAAPGATRITVPARPGAQFQFSIGPSP